MLSIGTFISILLLTLFMPIAGVVADKVNRKTLILVVDSSQIFAIFLLLVLFQFGLANISVVFIFIGVRSIFLDT